ncbi:hypothetical protein ACJJTC_012710 [Scirpophaga incertulas]
MTGFIVTKASPNHYTTTTMLNGLHNGAGSSASSEGVRPPLNEQRLLTSAWYQLGARCHRDAVETRFALLSAGHSFLARQRRQPVRGRVAPSPSGGAAASPSPATPAPAQ